MKKYKYIMAIAIIGFVYGIHNVSKRLYDYYSWAEERPTDYYSRRNQADDTCCINLLR